MKKRASKKHLNVVPKGAVAQPAIAEVPPRIKPFFATPMYGNRVVAQHHFSMLNLCLALQKAGIAWEYPAQAGTHGDAHIERARNDFLGLFLQTDCTHFFSIDADIAFRNPQDVVNQLLSGLEFTVGPYVKKQDKTEWTFIPLKGGQLKTWSHGLRMLEVQAGATGFMCLSRACVEKLCEGRDRYAGGSREHPIPCVDFFERKIMGFFIGEDVALCLRWRELGEQIWLNVDAKLVHIGDREYVGKIEIVQEKAEDNRVHSE